MATCEGCGNQYDKYIDVIIGGKRHTFDSFECAVAAVSPTCDHCSCRVIGHGIEVGDQIYGCADCAKTAGRPNVADRAA